MAGVAEAEQRAEGHEGSWAASRGGQRHLPTVGAHGGRAAGPHVAQQGRLGFRSEEPRAWGELGPGEEGREARQIVSCTGGETGWAGQADRRLGPGSPEHVSSVG